MVLVRKPTRIYWVEAKTLTEPVWETEEDEQRELPVREGEVGEGDLGSPGEMGGDLLLHPNVRLEPLFDQVSPIHSGGDTILLLVLGSKMVPHLSGSGWILGGGGDAGGGGGDAIFIYVELELLSAGGSHQTQGFRVCLFPDLDGSGLVGSYCFEICRSGIGFRSV